MRQNTAVLGITCFIEASSVALRESERKKMGKKEDPKELEEASKREKECCTKEAKEGCNFAVPKLPGLMKHR